MDKRYKVKDLKIGKIYLYDLRIGKEEDINKYIIFDSTNVDRAYINDRFIGKSVYINLIDNKVYDSYYSINSNRDIIFISEIEILYGSISLSYFTEKEYMTLDEIKDFYENVILKDNFNYSYYKESSEIKDVFLSYSVLVNKNIEEYCSLEEKEILKSELLKIIDEYSENYLKSNNKLQVQIEYIKKLINLNSQICTFKDLKISSIEYDYNELKKELLKCY